MRSRVLRRLTSSLAVFALAMTVTSCLDGPTGPLELGELKLLPTFAPGEDPAALGLTIDSARITVMRRAPVESVVDTVLPFTSGATLSWLLDLAADPETFDAEVELYGGADTLYAGGVSVSIALGFADGRVTNAVPLQYVGAPVTSPIAEIVVSPARITLVAAGATQQFTAEAYDATGALIPGVTFSWTSSAVSVATIGQASGVASAVAQGSTTITATAGGVSGTASLVVDYSGNVIRSITVTPSAVTLTALDETQQFVAAAYDAAGDPVGGATFAWMSSITSVATIDPASGLATAAGQGTTTISASVGSASGTAQLTVDLSGSGSGIASIVVTPASATLTSLGGTQQYTAQAFDAGGQPVSGVTFAWSSTIGPIASIDAATGLATAAGHGTTTIEASAGGVTGSATLTVDLSGPGSGIASISVTPSAATLGSIGATQQFTAQAFDVSGQPIFGVPFSWTSTSSPVASIDAASGLATAVDNGITTIEATAGGVTGSASLTVAQQVASIRVAPSAVTLDALGLTQAFTAAAFDANGVPIAGAVFSWSSSTPAVATVDASSGVATAVGNGQTVITASSGGVSGTAVLDVAQRVASVVVAPAVVELTALGATAQFTATALDAGGTVVPGVVFVWSSSEPDIATVDPATGLATALDGGNAIISATAQGVGVTGTAMMLVRP